MIEVAEQSNLSLALTYAEWLHRDQTYKNGRGTRYLTHLLEVCSLVLQDGGSEEEAIAALLHDAAEDQGGDEILEQIRLEFGDEIANLVAECSEPFDRPRAPWKHRKDRYIAHIPEASLGATRIITADKLANVRTILMDHQRIGPAVWNYFVPERHETIWFYETVFKRLKKRREEFNPEGEPDPLLEELNTAVLHLAALK